MSLSIPDDDLEQAVREIKEMTSVRIETFASYVTNRIAGKVNYFQGQWFALRYWNGFDFFI